MFGSMYDDNGEFLRPARSGWDIPGITDRYSSDDEPTPPPTPLKPHPSTVMFDLRCTDRNAMRGPFAVLTPCAQSHAFDERKVKIGPEDDPLKIGRAVARLRPGADNAIFDCKVLSRNHAVLYFDDGSFFLKDTKSSNGTFVNNERLATTGEESEPRQVWSGDILQFGVEIVENTNKVAHGCIFAMVRLYDEKGEEMEAPVLAMPRTEEPQQGYSLIASHQLFQLQQYLKEALFREKSREEKIRQLESVLAAMDAASETAWKAGVNEDRLLARIESLEATLSLYARPTNPEKLEMLTLIEQRSELERVSRDNILRAMEERTEARLRLADVERSLVCTEEECTRLTAKCEELEVSLKTAVTSYESEVSSTMSLTTAVLDAQRRADNADARVAELREAYSNFNRDESVEDLMRRMLTSLAMAPRLSDTVLLRSLSDVLVQMLGERAPDVDSDAEAHPSEPLVGGEPEFREEIVGGSATAESPLSPPSTTATTESEEATSEEEKLSQLTELEWKLAEKTAEVEEKEFIVERVREQLAEEQKEKETLIAELAAARRTLSLVPSMEAEMTELRHRIEETQAEGDGGGVAAGDSLSVPRPHSAMTTAIRFYGPSILLLSLVPGLGFVLLLIYPLLTRFLLDL